MHYSQNVLLNIVLGGDHGVLKPFSHYCTATCCSPFVLMKYVTYQDRRRFCWLVVHGTATHGLSRRPSQKPVPDTWQTRTIYHDGLYLFLSLVWELDRYPSTIHLSGEEEGREVRNRSRSSSRGRATPVPVVLVRWRVPVSKQGGASWTSRPCVLVTRSPRPMEHRLVT
jgi:hypothetical protein